MKITKTDKFVNQQIIFSKKKKILIFVATVTEKIDVCHYK